jgi:hypothetical protein
VPWAEFSFLLNKATPTPKWHDAAQGWEPWKSRRALRRSGAHATARENPGDQLTQVGFIIGSGRTHNRSRSPR